MELERQKKIWRRYESFIVEGTLQGTDSREQIQIEDCQTLKLILKPTFHIHLLQEMRLKQSLYISARRLEAAYRLVDEMVKKGLSLNATTYNLFFRVLSLKNDLEQSWELYLRMMRNGILPNTQSCMFLIKMFKRHEKVDMAMRLWDDMVAKGFGSYSFVSDVLLDLLCDLAKVDEAKKCLLQMIEKGYRPRQKFPWFSDNQFLQQKEEDQRLARSEHN